jgi:hydroxypyruvate isomerase
MLFTEHPFLQRFRAAAAAGFKYVEYQYPYAFDKAEIADALRAYAVAAVLHNLPQSTHAACDPAGTAEFRRGLDLAIEYALAAGCRQLNCLAGVVPEGVSQDLARDTLAANLRYAAEQTAKAGIGLLTEPINTRDVPGFYLNRTQQAVEFLAAVGSDNLKLQYDVYHMQIMEGDLARTIEVNLSSIAHIQVSDNPGRHEPGTGEINFPFLFGFLDRIGYCGYVGAEYRPAAGTLESLTWVKPYL